MEQTTPSSSSAMPSNPTPTATPTSSPSTTSSSLPSRSPISFRAIILVVMVLVLAGALAALQIWRTTPQRTLNAFLDAVERNDQTAAMAFVADDITTARHDNIQWFVEDWTSTDTVQIDRADGIAWRQRVKTEKNDKGEEVAKINLHGNRDVEIDPEPRYWSHLYRAEAVVRYADIEDPVVIYLRRTSDANWSRVGNIFQGWEIVKIVYQPLEDEDIIEAGDVTGDATGDDNGEAEFIDAGEEGAADFDVDAKGNIVLLDENGNPIENEESEDEE